MLNSDFRFEFRAPNSVKRDILKNVIRYVWNLVLKLFES